VPRQGLEPRTY